MKHLNFLSKSSSQSCGHSSVTLASTVGSPSAHRRGIMLKLVSVLVLIFTFGVGNVWGAEGDTHSISYTDNSSFPQQSGLNNNASISSASITGLNYTVKKVELSVRTNKSVSNVDIEVLIGTTSLGTQNKSGNSTETLTFQTDPVSSLSGNITIKFTNNCTGSSKQGSFWLNTVTLTEGASSTPTYTITTQSNNTSYGTVSKSGSVITGSPKSGYRYASPAYSVSPANSATVSQNGNAFTVTPSANTTVTINFEPIPTHKISFNTGGLVEIADATGIKEGDTYNISQTPASSLTANCEYGTFVGWTTASSIADASVSPSIITSYTMSTSDVTLHAVYSKTTGGGGEESDSKTFTFSSIASANSWENSVAYTEVTISPVTINANGGGNNGKWYTSGGGSWRMYSGGTLEISVTGGSVSSVTSSPECTFTISNGKASFSPSARTDFTEIIVNYTATSAGTTTYSLTPNCCQPLGSINGSINLSHF